MGKKKVVVAVEAADTKVANEVTSETATAAETEVAQSESPAPKPKKGKRSKGDTTLEAVFAGYLDRLEKDGKSNGTIASYRMELALAGEELGLDTKVAELTPKRVLLFFGSERVMKLRSGRPKSQLSVDKTRRVLRQALVWAEGAKLVAKAPLPELAASH